jgi:hypothetical protein
MPIGEGNDGVQHHGGHFVMARDMTEPFAAFLQRLATDALAELDRLEGKAELEQVLRVKLTTDLAAARADAGRAITLLHHKDNYAEAMELLCKMAGTVPVKLAVTPCSIGELSDAARQQKEPKSD